MLPNEPNLRTAAPVTLTESERDKVGGLSFGTLFLWVVVCAGIWALEVGILAMIGALLTTVLIHYYLFWNENVKRLTQEKTEQERKSIEAANEQEVRRVNSEAASLTSSLVKTYEHSAELAPTFPAQLNQASSWLRTAEGEYEASAFSPFWDAVENAAKHLADFNQQAHQMSRYADEYYRKLSGRKHSFPVFPVRLATIPWPAARMVSLGLNVFS